MSTDTKTQTIAEVSETDTETQTQTIAGFEALFAFVAFPLALAHEATHALASAPWAVELAIVMEPRSRNAMVHVNWDEDAPAWGMALAHVAPTLVGSVVIALLAGWWAGSGYALPTDLGGWAGFVSSLGVGLVYTAPSRTDIRGALHVLC